MRITDPPSEITWTVVNSGNAEILRVGSPAMLESRQQKYLAEILDYSLLKTRATNDTTPTQYWPSHMRR